MWSFLKQKIWFVALPILVIFLAACNPIQAKVKSGLQVQTGDTPTSLFLNGQYLGKTPFINKDIKPGTYTLKIQPENTSLASYETEVTLRKGLLTVVTWVPGPRPEASGGVIYEMEKLPDGDKTQLTINTIPDAAIIKIPDRETEFAPVTINDLPAGEKRYEVSLPSYDTQSHTVNVVPGYHTTIAVKLAKARTNNMTQASASPVPSSTPSASPVTPSASPRASASPTIAASASGTIRGPKVTINSTNFFQEGKEVSRVRGDSNPGGKTLGFAPVGNDYKYLGKSENNWHQIEFNGQTGWVSGQFSTVTK